MTNLGMVWVRILETINEVRDTHEMSDITRENLIDLVNLMYKIVNRENEQ